MVRPRIDIDAYASGNGALSFSYSFKKYVRGKFIEESREPDFIGICEYFEKELKPKGYRLIKKNGNYHAAIPVHKFEDGKICIDGENTHFEYDEYDNLWSVHSDGKRLAVHPQNSVAMAIRFWLAGGFEILI